MTAQSGVTAIVVAAGSGERLGAGPKAFVQVAGQPIVVHAVRAVASAVDVVVVVVGPQELEHAEAVLRDAGLEVSAVCAGGATRQESVVRGLRSCQAGTGVVAVHDAARALVSPELVARTIAALVDPWSAVAPGLPVVDTLKLVGGGGEEGEVARTVDRRALWAVQTPQVFRRATLERVHARTTPMRGASPCLDAATDDLALVEDEGGRVRLVPGERRNFKITYPEDLAMAEALLAAERAGP